MSNTNTDYEILADKIVKAYADHLAAIAEDYAVSTDEVFERAKEIHESINGLDSSFTKEDFAREVLGKLPGFDLSMDIASAFDEANALPPGKTKNRDIPKFNLKGEPFNGELLKFLPAETACGGRQ